MKTKKNNNIYNIFSVSYWTLVIIFIFLVVYFGQPNLIKLGKILISVHPTAEAGSIISAENVCQIWNPVSKIFFKSGGFINLNNSEIKIEDDLTKEQEVSTQIHENCHKRQIEQGNFSWMNGTTTKSFCYEKILPLERECY